MPELCLRQRIEEKRIIAFLKEGLLPPVASLGDVVRDAGEDETGEAGHALGLARRRGSVNNLGIYARVTVILIHRNSRNSKSTTLSALLL
jgi:hypothetical protein